MKIKFWGARGGIATAEPDVMKYGGHTSCVEVRLDSGELLIIDAGTGIRRLGNSLLSDTSFNKSGHLIISHCHWDHIQGFPFFVPAFLPQYKWKIYGQLKLDGRLEDLLRQQMGHLYFPVKLDQMGAEMKFVEIIEEEFYIGGAKITSRHLNHPQGNMGFRIEDKSGVFVYANDTEHFQGRLDAKVLELANNADIFLYDAQYTEEEYTTRVGWGHSTWREGVKLALEANAKQLVLFHHDPNHNDDFIDREIVAKAQQLFPNTIAAQREMELVLGEEKQPLIVPPTPQTPTIHPQDSSAIVESHIFYEKGRLYIRVPNDLEIFRHSSFSQNLEKFLEEQKSKSCVMDFIGIQDIDSSSLGTLAKYYDQARKNGFSMKLINVNDFILEVLTITRFIQLIEVEK